MPIIAENDKWYDVFTKINAFGWENKLRGKHGQAYIDTVIEGFKSDLPAFQTWSMESNEWFLG